MIAHAAAYSPAFSAEGLKALESGQVPQNELWKYSSFWYKDFDNMACKTMLRQLIGKWGLMSIEMQKAFDADGGVIGDNGEVTFSDSERENNEPQQPDNIIDAEVVTEPEAEESFADMLGG